MTQPRVPTFPRMVDIGFRSAPTWATITKSGRLATVGQDPDDDNVWLVYWTDRAFGPVAIEDASDAIDDAGVDFAEFPTRDAAFAWLGEYR